MTPADDSRGGSTPRLVLVISAVVAAVVAGLGLGLVDRGAGETSGGDRQEVDTSPDRDAAAVVLLRRQEQAVRRGALSDFTDTWAEQPAAQRRARTVYSNLTDLRVVAMTMRYVAADVGLPLERQRELGGEAWTAEVEVRWRLADFDSRPVTSTVTFTFVEARGGVLVADVQGSSDDRDPVWLVDDLHVARTSRTLAIGTSRAEAEALTVNLRTAVRDVQGVLPDWRGGLVAYLPDTTTQLEAILGTASGAHNGIAAVTTTVDGSQPTRAPVAIMLNPEVFDRLGPTGRRVVISHEAAHVATNAVTVDLPLWIAEGFADYVGVGAVDVPLAVSARLALRQMARERAPTRLPTDEDFSATASDLEATYELAWLATRLIANEYGEDALVEFYESVVDDPGNVSRAFRQHLGTSQAAFTRLWRDHLVELADAR